MALEPKAPETVLVITGSPFPYGTAMSSRMRAFCQLFLAMGYAVHVIARYTRQGDCESQGRYGCGGFTFEALSNQAPRSIDTFFRNRELLLRAEKVVRSRNIAFVFSDGCQCDFTAILKAARAASVPYYVEQCEKYDLSSYRFGRFDVRHIRYLRLYRRLYRRASGIVAISRYLEGHYRELRAETVRIPTILDVESLPAALDTCNRRIRLVYTGVAWGHKELLAPIIRAIADSQRLSPAYEFHIYGTGKAQLLGDEPGLAETLSRAEDCVKFRGTIPQEEIHEVLRNADYQIFLRPDRESSRAGFPTKFGESMAAGTPVIANITGDIGLYLEDGRNGFALPGTTEECVKGALERILALTPEERMRIRRNARATAEVSFNYRAYVRPFAEMVKATARRSET